MINLPHPMSLVFKSTTGSTNTDAAELALAGAADLTVVWARRQNAARGRYGRAWHAPDGNLFWSVVVHIRPNTPLDGLSIVSAMAVYDAVKTLLPRSATLAVKWPNDVLIRDRKVSGILIERSGAEAWAVVGIGINVAHAPPATLTKYPATALAAEGVNVTLESVVLELSRAFLNRISEWREEGFSARLRDEYLSSLWRLNETVTISFDAERRVTKTGRLLGVDDLGHLLLETDGVVSTIAAGDVF